MNEKRASLELIFISITKYRNRDMVDFNDRYGHLPQTIDVGGDRYFMGSQKPIELGFKSRKNYIDTFGKDQRTEYLLRKYMYYSLSDKKKTRFEEPNDKSDLIKILKKRAKSLEESKEFTSSVLKNTIIQRSYINIQQLLKDLEGAANNNKSAASSQGATSTPPECEKDKKNVKELSQDRLFTIMLQIAWYLLNPDKVPSEIQCSWASLVKNLDTLRLGDIVESTNEADSSSSPFNYFKKINLAAVGKAPTIKNALEQAKDMAKKIEGENANDQMKKRVERLLKILEMKKYLTRNTAPSLNNSTLNRINKQMLMNPMTGGAAKTLDKPLGIAMSPFFDYFKSVYDPIYTLLESFINGANNADKTKKIVIPLLTTLLYISNNLNPSETATGGANTYGVYKIKNVDSDLIEFVNRILSKTEIYVEKFAKDSDKNAFNNQIFKLPRVRLTAVLNTLLNSGATTPDELVYVQFLTLNGNATLIPKEDFVNSKKSERSDEVYNAVQEFFTSDLYIICTKLNNVKENIPMNVYEIDFSQVDVENTIKIDNLPDNYFNKNKNPELYLESLIAMKHYVVFNDAELALSIFIAFKELIPK